ncbi:hypothetical protein SDC9_194432 [bioreactor metagenome]|uniref:Sialate O-acetylesterase domain-containing protein n=1 Tax=bioreactor metagenome TaxID=1076179 RepID=A0A645IHL0_9ZZZZ
MIQSLRTELNEPDLFLVAGELAYWRGGGTGSTAFNTMIRTISSNITKSDWVSAEGLTPLIDESDPHFDGNSQKILGERYADKIIANVYNTTSTVTIKKNDFPSLKTSEKGIKIENKNGFIRYIINDISGRTVKFGDLQPNQSTDISVNQGMYFISFIQDNIHQTVKVFVY